MPNPTVEVPALVEQLYEVVAKLENMFPRRTFTLDGHLVGSIGEVLAAEKYSLTLLPMTEPTHDAAAPDGRQVQIKTTQGRSVGLRAKPDHLLVLSLDSQGAIDEVYNGPGEAPWNAAGKMQRNGQRSIGVAKLRTLMADVRQDQRV